MTAGGPVVHAVTADDVVPGCPRCGVVSTARKGRVVTFPRDVPYGDRVVRLVWHKRRWRCREPLCPRGSFTESIPQLPPRARITARLREEVGAAVADGFSCVLAAAEHYQVSWPIAHRAFAGHVAGPLAQPLPVVGVLGIDETRRGKPVWEQDPVTRRWRIAHDRWHTGIVDAVGTSGRLAHVDGRTSAAVTEWLDAQRQAWRDQVTHVTIDLSASYAKAVRDGLPGAVRARFELGMGSRVARCWAALYFVGLPAAVFGLRRWYDAWPDQWRRSGRFKAWDRESGIAPRAAVALTVAAGIAVGLASDSYVADLLIGVGA